MHKKTVKLYTWSRDEWNPFEEGSQEPKHVENFETWAQERKRFEDKKIPRRRILNYEEINVSKNIQAF